MNHGEIAALMHIMEKLPNIDHSLVHIRNHAHRRLREINDSMAPTTVPAPAPLVPAQPVPSELGEPGRATTSGVVPGQDVVPPALVPEPPTPSTPPDPSYEPQPSYQHPAEQPTVADTSLRRI